MNFRSLNEFLKFLNSKRYLKNVGTVSGCFWPTTLQARPGPARDVAHGTQADGTVRDAHDTATAPETGTAARLELACPWLRGGLAGGVRTKGTRPTGQAR
jgi:hypothetical protein